MKLYSTQRLLNKYSRDRSIYSIRPKYVVFPKTEEEIIEIVKFAYKHKLPITPRGGGTGLSGSSIGKGIIVDFSKYFTKIYKIGKITKIQSGILIKKLKPKVEKSSYMLPSVPWHDNCAIGGTINTDSIGPRTLKYGTMDKQVKSLRGILANGRILDTSKSNKIPHDIKKKILYLQKKIKKEKTLIKYLKSRPLVAGGYNLLSLIKYKKIEDIITHLIVSSTGTLLLLTEITLKLPKYKEIQNTYLTHFKDFDSLQKALNKAIKLGAATIEYVGKETLFLWHKKYHSKRSIGALIIAFESKTNFALKDSLEIREIPKKQRNHLWKTRSLALPKLEQKARKIGLQLPSGIDDTSFDPKYFSRIMKDVNRYEKQTKIPIASFGHIGVGSLHLRPFIDMKRHPEKLNKIGLAIFKIVRKYGGTLIGEHNAGLCRSRYLPMESKLMYSYMKKVKDILDPENILNPKVIFNLDPITENINVD